jgi:DNA-binding response OmpR family regulator
MGRIVPFEPYANLTDRKHRDRAYAYCVHAWSCEAPTIVTATDPMSLRVLLVEDDHSIAAGVERALSALPCSVISATHGLHADTLLATETFDLVILDLGLPGMGGLDVLARMRKRQDHVNAQTPVLILSARGNSEARVHGLDTGADDYLTKPFDLAEFQARVRALLRRAQPNEIQVGHLRWNRTDRQVRIRGNPLVLSRLETAVFHELVRRPGRIVGKDELADRAEGQGPADNKVEVYIHRLRRKLQGSGAEIRTVRGLGYALFASSESAP